jgi:hypothetical protein
MAIFDPQIQTNDNPRDHPCYPQTEKASSEA